MKKDDVIDTGFPGIKQRKSDGKYVVILDLGRQWKKNKAGELVLKQVKTQKVVDTLKEAKALRGENDQTKRFKKVSGITGRRPFEEAIQDYFDFMDGEWGISSRELQHRQSKRALTYFHGVDVREIETLDIEKFFRWCKDNKDFKPISNNTIIKLKSQLNSFYKWLLKAPKRYGVTKNPVENASVGEEESFEASILSVDDVNSFLAYILNNEADTADMVLFGLGVFCGLRRGEICGLQWQDIHWEEKRIWVCRQRAEVNSDPRGWTILTPKEGKENGKTSEERRERWTALPDHLAEILKLAKLQQEAYGGDVKPDDFVYRTKANIVDNYLAMPKTLWKRLAGLQNRYNKVRKKRGEEPLSRLRPHDLRHTHVSMCLNNGVNPLTVSASVGHKLTGREFNTTIRVYWHDDGNRTAINECIDRLVTVPILVPDMESRLLIPKRRDSGRVNIRSDEL